MLLLHDHGAKFDIGKEKLIEPFDDTPAKLESARAWVARYYGGRFIGDELARRGYVCVGTDMLNWSDRGGCGYDNQQAIAANLLQFGTSWAGLIAHEDLRAAAFTMTHPGLAAHLDHPDVASIACPKPMLFQCGRRDALFPLAATTNAFQTLRRVCDSQGVGNTLETRLYDAPHEFNAVMQDEAFPWLDQNLRR